MIISFQDAGHMFQIKSFYQNKIKYATKHPLFDYRKKMKTFHLLFPGQ